MPDTRSMTEELSRTARDAAYVAVGLGVMGVQRAQVRRRELTERLSATAGTLTQQLERLTSQLDRFTQELAGAAATAQQQVERLGSLPGDLATTIGDLADTIEALIAKAEQLVQPIEQRLPSPMREALERARTQASAARQQLRQRVLHRAA